MNQFTWLTMAAHSGREASDRQGRRYQRTRPRKPATNVRHIISQFSLTVLNTTNSAPLSRRHRAATTGALPFLRLLLASTSPTKPHAPRLNLQDRAGNTPLHLALESGHGEIAVALIEAGADRERTDQDGLRAEEIPGVGGQEAKKVREYSKPRLNISVGFGGGERWADHRTAWACSRAALWAVRAKLGTTMLQTIASKGFRSVVQ